MYKSHCKTFLAYIILEIYLTSIPAGIISRWDSNYARWKFFFCPHDFSRSSSIRRCLSSRFIVLYLAGKKKRYLIDKIYCGTPVSIAEQIYLLCGQQPPHRFLASILVPLFLKYWLTPGFESYLTNESMYDSKRERRRETIPTGLAGL